MDRGGVEAGERFPVLGSAVTFVTGEAIPRVPSIQFDHQSIPGDFCYNRGGGYREG